MHGDGCRMPEAAAGSGLAASATYELAGSTESESAAHLVKGSHTSTVQLCTPLAFDWMCLRFMSMGMGILS